MRATRSSGVEDVPAWAAAFSRRSIRKRARLRVALGVFCGSALLAATAVPQGGAETPAAAVMDGALAIESDAGGSPEAVASLHAASDNEGEVEAKPVAAGAQDPALVADAVPGGATASQRQSTLDVVTGQVTRGSTVAGELSKLGVDRAAIHEIDRAMRPVFDFRRARVGDFFALIRDEGGSVLSFEYQRGRRDVYRLELAEGQLVASERRVPLERRVVQLGGAVRGSLFESLRSLGERPALVHGFTDIFAWEFDFARQTRPGDEFRLLVEKYYDRDGFVEYGKILAAEYRSGDRDLVAVHFEDEHGYGDYYTPEGESVRRAFLRAPVKYSRISSRYSKARLHPVLKVRRPHEGIDYAAPVGTPVWSVADGVVVFAGWNGGFGKLIQVKHNNGYVSYYGHLSRFADGLEPGARVRQKQVIGYVGSTGLSTGPHLDFRLKIAGRFIDPLEARFPQGAPIPVENRDRFDEIKDLRLAELRETRPVELEAAM